MNCTYSNANVNLMWRRRCGVRRIVMYVMVNVLIITPVYMLMIRIISTVKFKMKNKIHERDKLK